jgi:hypothetical protein
MWIEAQIKPDVLAEQMSTELSIEEAVDFVSLLAAGFADKDFDVALLKFAQENMGVH